MKRLNQYCIIVATMLCMPFLSYAATNNARQPIPLDRIVAIVNDEVITQYDIDERIKDAATQLQKQNIPLPPRDVLEKQILEHMITDRAQLQYAKETGLRVDDVQLDKTIERIAQENKLSLPEFRNALERDGVSFGKFRDEIRNEILLVRLREREVDNKVVVSEGEIDNFLKTKQLQKGNEEQYNLAHILIRVPEQASPEQIQTKRARGEEALNRLKGGADFGQISAAYSDAPDALHGGIVGWRAAGSLPPLFVDALKTMKPGEVSAVLRSPNGFHILKLLDKGGNDSPVMVQQTHARHILIKINELTSETDAKNRLIALKERIDNGANFAELARLHSEDTSASKGGDLGWIAPGDLVPPFERAMNALKPGQISEPVQTNFGWHLIQVIARRNEDMSKERQRLRARQEIRARKADEAFQEWVRQLRDRAYVEYRREEK